MADKPQIVMLTNDRRIDRRILLEADSLEAAGWDVVIIAMTPDAPIARDDPRVVRLGAGTAGQSALLSGYRGARALLPMNSKLMRFAKAFAWRFLADQEKFWVDLYLPTARQYVPRIFLAHDLPMLPVAAAAAKATGALYAYDSHELFAEQGFSARERDRWIGIERKHINGATVVTTVNESIADLLSNRYGVNDVTPILNAEHPFSGRENPRLFHQNLHLPHTARVLLYQGGLVATRNLETIVDAMALVEDESIVLVMLGDGQLRQTLESRASRAGLAHRVRILDAVPQDQLLAWSASADVGLIPYVADCLNTYYCTPNKLFEFIAAGLPILASDLPELRRFVTGNAIGLNADLTSPEAMAAAISSMFSDASRLQHFRESVLSARQEISWEREGARLAALYEPLRLQTSPSRNLAASTR